MFETFTLILALVEAPAADSHSTMSPEMFIGALYVFALAAFLGYQVISRVPPLLHTPLMSATNAISAISVLGAHHLRLPRRRQRDDQRRRRLYDHRPYAPNVPQETH